ncbi:MAG: hypothetical protein NTX64_06985 [Elusimicrobia bacterium]|nr:hypothetical protein [Elusimicrobiota bacterium]
MKWREKLVLLALLAAMVAIAYLAFNSGPKEAATSRVTSPATGQAAAPFPSTEQAAAPSRRPVATRGSLTSASSSGPTVPSSVPTT